MTDKEVLKDKVLTHSENGNLEKANEYLDEYMEHPDTSKKDIDSLVMKALEKAQNR